jgi:hypothetical protein
VQNAALLKPIPQEVTQMKSFISEIPSRISVITLRARSTPPEPNSSVVVRNLFREQTVCSINSCVQGLAADFDLIYSRTYDYIYFEN